jgi:DNA polymerase elongation subunit (family B)
MFLREQRIKHDTQKDDLKFQIVSWHTCDHEYKEESDSDSESEAPKQNTYNKNYLVKVFGVTAEGYSVSLNLLDFTPYFFIKIPFAINDFSCPRFRDFLVAMLPGNLRESLISVKLIKKQDFYGFHNGKKFNFIRFTFNSLRGFKQGARVFQKKVQIPGFPIQRYRLYENNIEPFLRMMHIRDIEPTGWVKVKAGNYHTNADILPTTCQLDMNCKWNVIERYQNETMAPLIIASFDLECMSSHGDFPVPVKDYRKVANEIIQNINPLCDSEFIVNEIVKIFCPDQDGRLSKVFTKRADFKNLEDIQKRVKKNIDDILSILKGKLVYINDRLTSPGPVKVSRDDITQTLVRKLNSIGLPALEGDPIIQIGTTVHVYGEKSCNYKSIITLGTCDPIDDVDVIQCETEADMILKWKDLIVRIDPDVITGYNIFGFDFEYIFKRSKELGINGMFTSKLGRVVEGLEPPPGNPDDLQDWPYVRKKLASSALGENLLKYIDMEGRVLIDLMKVVQRDHKLDSYKLDAVANHFMKMNKHDVSPNDIFRLFRGNSADRKIVGEYCVMDCELCNLLIMKLETLANNVGMSNVCNVPLSYIFLRGQGIKIFSLVAKQCRQDDFLIPEISKYNITDEEDTNADDEDGYEGAIVLPPKCGIYIDEPVSVLDYASLYPSSMISENLSQDTLVMDERFNNIEGVEYLDISYDLYEGVGDKKQKVGTKVCRFVQTKEKGVLPRILMKLLRQRKETRKKIDYQSIKTVNGNVIIGLLKETGDKVIVNGADGKMIAEIPSDQIIEREDTYNEFQKAVLDGLQLAYKVTANSLYGQCGAKTSSIYCKEVAASTTATGRNMIMKAKEFIEKNYDAQIVYGDSVTGYTPVLIRQDNLIKIETIEELAEKYGNNNWIKCIEIGKQDKESCEITNVDTWTDSGWTKIHRVIRHKLTDTKKIIRINTHSGIVDVTNDHSLLRLDKTEVSPSNLQIGDSLLHSPFPVINNNCNIHSVDEARIMGFFCGDGSCGDYDCPSGRKCSWALNNSDMELQEKYKRLCEDTYPDLQWKILDTLESSGVYKLVPGSKDNYGGIREIVRKYRKLMYYNKEKIVPITILNSSYEIRKSFWEGLYDADGDKDGIITRIDQKNQISIAMFNLLGDSLGYNTSLNSRTDKLNIFRLNLTKKSQRKDPNTIKKMYEIPYNGYVYDLTTDNHHFQAGVGRLIVHNTDSLFVKFANKDANGNPVKGKDALLPSIHTACEVSKEFKKTIKAPHDLEYEKTFFPFILLSKKRYIANKYEFDVEHCKQASMGVVLKRRDNAPIVKTVYGGIIDTILNDRDVKKSLIFLKDTLNNLVEGKFPLEELIISKSLKSEYKDPERIAHKVLADRMKERDPGSAPQVNDRLPFVYIQIEGQKKGEKILQGNRIEHPDYIKANKIKPDYEFYLTNQIMKPVLQVYALVVEELPGYNKGFHYFKDMYPRLLEEKEHDEKKARDRLNDLKEDEVKKILFDPILNKLKNKREGNREITDFFKFV